jgi:hypothetical protein
MKSEITGAEEEVEEVAQCIGERRMRPIFGSPRERNQ